MQRLKERLVSMESGEIPQAARVGFDCMQKFMAGKSTVLMCLTLIAVTNFHFSEGLSFEPLLNASYDAITNMIGQSSLPNILNIPIHIIQSSNPSSLS